MRVCEPSSEAGCPLTLVGLAGSLYLGWCIGRYGLPAAALHAPNAEPTQWGDHGPPHYHVMKTTSRRKTLSSSIGREKPLKWHGVSIDRQGLRFHATHEVGTRTSWGFILIINY